ncbi:membrane bound cell division protein at septum containing leucine zipper motif [Candidatus Regiella insecticola LSR1]|uniref:Cell division protein FtsL n=1 Tax=Candidatus Regiella insecticola LSR1 TaxID=663321 RepID=E0WRY7_9ENTR|nr:cell division protein FtsL [Candidatus Regiella insecticola]EFL92121.1 membrane bound cell division protein at septum containing leucine zipper motif [Candidatus Regiella insecticola LSR1]
MISYQKYSLIQLIGTDLVRNAKIPLILLFTVLLSAILVVTTTYQTRLLTAKRELLILERNALDIEWRNLILEEKALSAHHRIATIARKKLKMQYVAPEEEKIVIDQSLLHRYGNKYTQ